MSKIKELFLVDNQGNKMEVVLPISDYEKVLQDLEEFEAIRAFDAAKGGFAL